jgi:hypothetical protein
MNHCGTQGTGRSSRVALLLFACAALVPDIAWADGVGDFNRSVRRRPRATRPTSAAQAPIQATDPSSGYGDGDAWLAALMLWGMAPGRAWSFGGSPFGTRGWVDDTAPSASGAMIGSTGQGLAAPAVTNALPPAPSSGPWKDPVDAPPAFLRNQVDLQGQRARRVHLELEGSPLWLLDRDAPARGWQGWVRLESAFTPAVSLAHLSLGDLRTEDQFMMTTAAYEPRWIMTRHVTLRPTLGVAFLADQNGALNAGPTAGLNLTLYPQDPVLIDLRAGVQPLVGTPLTADLSLAVGVEVLDSVFVLGSLRWLGNGDASLGLATIGLRIDLGL